MLPNKTNCFKYCLVGNDTNNGITVHLYSFKCLFNQHYIVEVECHKDSIFIIKYFQKNHKDSKYRYTLLNGKSQWKKPENAKNFLAILNTVTNIIVEIYYKKDKASFGFMGAPTKKENNPSINKDNINEDGTVAKTKRYNIYGLYVRRYFSPKQFEHIDIESSSSYVLRNKDNSNLSNEKIEKFFLNYITDFS